MLTRNHFKTESEYTAWVYQRIYNHGLGWLAAYCFENEIEVTEEALEERLYEQDPVGQFEEDFQTCWSVAVDDVIIPTTLPELIAGVRASKGITRHGNKETIQAFKSHVQTRIVAQLTKDAETDTPQETQENAQFALEEGVGDLVDHLWQNIAGMPGDSDFYQVWVDVDEGGMWVLFTPEEAEAMCRTAYPDVFQLIDGAITTVGGAAWRFSPNPKSKPTP